MDAATRDELNALRRRAYGPGADVTSSDPEWARLVELEELALPSVSRGPSARSAAELPQSVPEPMPAATEAAAVVTSIAVPEAPWASTTNRWVLALAATSTVAIVAIAALLAGGGRAPSVPDASPAGGTEQNPAIQVPVMIIESTGEYIDLSTISTAPDFPVRGEMAWAQPLGEHYGWSLWIGGADAGRRDQSCLLLTDGTDTRARCVSLDDRTRGELVVSLPYGRIAEDHRPTQMTSDQSVRFRWSTGGFVSVAALDPDVG